MYNLFKLKSSLDKTSSYSFLEVNKPLIPSQLNNALGSYILSSSQTNNFSSSDTSNTLYNLEKSFSLTAVPEITRSNNKVSLNLSALNLSSSVGNNIQNLLNLSIINNLNIAKESR
jgi:hypothetical protein